MMPIELAKHPCFNKDARHEFGRVHLPVAPKCNIQCHYCNRKYDCANENRPGVSNGIVSPAQALYYLKRIVETESNLAVVGIAGPGDAFATPDETLETLRLVRANFPGMLLCVATNGWNVTPYISALAALRVSHITITVNAVDPAVGEPVYAWVRDGKVIYRKQEAVRMLITRQMEAIRALKEAAIVVKINTILIPGINDHHVLDIAEAVKEAGADIMNCIPLVPVAETPFEAMVPPSASELQKVRKDCVKILPQMEHCTRCRADAVGRLGTQPSVSVQALLRESKLQPLNPSETRPYVAVASQEGFLVNQHLGEAEQLWIFEKNESGFQPLETRTTPPPGGGELRWRSMAELLKDCRALLVSSAGKNPVEALSHSGIKVVFMEGLIEEGLTAIYGGVEIRAPLRQEHRCGSGCAGTGTGCL